jgi:hypothetical protein
MAETSSAKCCRVGGLAKQWQEEDKTAAICMAEICMAEICMAEYACLAGSWY